VIDRGGDAFLGAMMGYLATAAVRLLIISRAMVYGSVVASFCCGFGLQGTTRIKPSQINQRVRSWNG
jgi:hypothetical protein